MRENLPRILDHATEGTMVASLYDDSIVYVNPIAQRYFPGAAEGVLMTEMIASIARHDGYISSIRNSSFQAFKDDPGLTITAEHTPIRGGMWVIGSRLPEVAGFPPTAIFTYRIGPKTDACRVEAFAQHTRTALAARIALELDESKRDINNAMTMLLQAHGRVDALTEALVSAASSWEEINELESLGSLGTLSG